MNIFIIYTLAILFVLFVLVGYLIFRQHKLKQKTKYFPQDEDLFLDIPDFQIRYQIVGHGPKLVLIHGIGANMNTWDPLIPFLKEDFTILRFDLPGFGASSKPIQASYNLDAQSQRLYEILKKLEFNQAYLCGSSMGGALSLWLAKIYPENFKKVIALAPATNKKLLPLNPKHLLISSRLTSLAINEQTMRFILYRVVHNHDLIDSDYIEKYLKHFKNQPSSIKTFLGATEVIADKRLPKQLNELKNPVLIYWGEHDQMVPFKYMKELSNILPNSQLITDSQAGHHSMEDNPKGLSTAIKQFLFT